MSTLKAVSSKLAAEIDKELMGPSIGFTLQQLMELAGLSVAEAINREFPLKSAGEKKNVFILAGPGNNGGDGLVCARHLKLFGYNPIVYYPKRTEKVEFYKQLVNQLSFFKVPVLGPENNDNWLEYLKADKTVCIVDALFGFSFKPPLREPFATIIKEVCDLQDKVPVVTVDVPSGWDVDDGPVSEPHIIPKILVSLTVPKPCSQFLQKSSVHYVGGRFIAPEFARKYGFEPFEYQSCDQILKL
ncbi:hypothetical protein KAFR_0A07720 [Kazachstania africana CBS 2517]|uniref:NAD(P)H-hydrate epimerase n=1 Tax=Kazachstania africana (strain ATCC 22294 / BCRC 22015 / CBS 2517 / CECT 1963 / NBRC 1671 / NRRL Y-8276) TaxID=1071382 RepID=H2APA6_KAZAF|nr:hypothetical protein KAFR_0A07720 [Kazachstania africana CBS 2517]CCF56206.1 hypothetical protein KAFR_0A07720 [Kazachstania africana CBS 2517]